MSQSVRYSVGANTIAMETVLGDLDMELAEMQDRYGEASRRSEDAFFHCSRAFYSLDTELMAREADIGKRTDRLVHMAAVCLRFAAAMSVEGKANG